MNRNGVYGFVLCCVALYVGGCGGDIEYNTSHSACGEFNWHGSRSFFTANLTKDCVSILVEALHFNEDSFNFQASKIEEAITTPDVVISGAAALFFTETITVESLIDDDYAPGFLVAEADNLIQSEHIEENSSIGELFFYMTTMNVRKIEAKYSPDDNYLMEYKGRKIHVNHLFDNETERNINDTPVILSAGLLIHEVGHIVGTKNHVECSNGTISCDYSEDSPYGISAYFTTLWWNAAQRNDITPAPCIEYMYSMEFYCSRINNPGKICSDFLGFDYEGFCL